MRKDSNDTNANRNQTVKWCLQQSFIDLDDRLLKFINPVRGVYGIFIKDKDQKICVYVGKAENLYSRMFSDNGHLVRIRKGKHTNPKLNEAIEKGKQFVSNFWKKSLIIKVTVQKLIITEICKG